LCKPSTAEIGGSATRFALKRSALNHCSTVSLQQGVSGGPVSPALSATASLVEQRCQSRYRCHERGDDQQVVEA
jgi:hypothetical protein